ncbi:MAG: hypothetical protein QM817_13220 [Archangium sp.]
MRSAAKPATFTESPHPVPLVCTIAFGLLALGLSGLALLVREPTAMAIDSVFVALAAFFGWHSIPSVIRLDERGVAWRRRLLTQRVEWSEVARLTTGLSGGADMTGWVTIHFTNTAAGLRGTPTTSVHSVANLQQDELIERMRALWEAAGGSGETGTIGDVMRETTDQLVKMGRVINQVTLGEKPESFAPPAPFTAITAYDENGRAIARLTTGSDDPLAIFETFFAQGLAQAREHRFNPAFDGALEFVLTTTPTPVLDERMKKLTEGLAAEMERIELRAATGARIIPTWRYARISAG